MRNTILHGDALEIARTLPDESVHCIVTSPPYYGLRDYGEPGQLGLEGTPGAYVARLVELFGELRRVLRDDGTAWLNLGDSYAGNNTSSGEGESRPYSTLNGGKGVGPNEKVNRQRLVVACGNVPQKNLLLMPARVALALQADGWYIRSDIIWHKPNPMPESVTDRPTKAHEYIFLLSKSARYFYDAEAIKAPNSDPARRHFGHGMKMDKSRNDTTRPDFGPGSNGRNRRTVWTVATQPYTGAHFAVFPPKLIEPCILAGTSAKGVCGECGAPLERVVEAKNDTSQDRKGNLEARANGPASRPRADGTESSQFTKVSMGTRITTTTGWRPTCDHDAPVVPAVVLDPFMGSGTTASVAKNHGRDWLGIELNADYIDLAYKRINETQPALFTT